MKCEFIKQNKDRCGANAISFDIFCFTHSPKTRDAKKQAVIKGGKALKPRLGEELLPFMLITKRDHLKAVMEETIQQLQTSPMTYQKALSIGSLMTILLKIETEKIEPKVQYGLFDLLRDEMERKEREKQGIIDFKKKNARLQKQEYLKLLEKVINGLRTTVMTPQKAQAIANLASRALDIMNDLQPEGRSDFIEKLRHSLEKKSTASVQ